MADDLLIPRRLRRPPRPRWSWQHWSWEAMPVAARIALLYLAARAVTTGLLLLAASLSGPGSRFGADATLGDLVVGWDAQWYWFVAVHGYPATLPLTGAGLVAENQWAFMPVYAYAAAGVGMLVGSWGGGALLLSLVSGYLSCLVLYRMVRPRIGTGAGLWAVTFFAAGPLAAMFQVGYAESLFLLWLFLALDAVQRRRYGLLFLWVPLMGFTRPGVLAFALFLGLYGCWRWARRRDDALRVREVVQIAGAAALATAVGFAWQLIAAAVTGDPSAYLATELAWRRNWLPDSAGGFVPFDGFVQAAAFWFTEWGLGPVAGYVAIVAVVLGAAAVLLFEPHVRRLGVEVRLWSASYLLYLLAVFFPQSSVFRLLMPLAPLSGALAVPRSTVWRAGVLAACLVGQWCWIFSMYAMGNTFWQIP